MPAATRLEDICTGHGCFPPRKNISASANVFVNSRGWHRKGDAWDLHSCGDNAHTSSTEDGSSSVYVNSRRAARIGDPVKCGSACGTGSPNVFCGG